MTAGGGSLVGRTAVVTGGARGIGEGIVRRLVDDGAQVVIADVRRELAAALADEVGSAAAAFELDVTSEEGWADLVAFAEATFSDVDVLVNNAGRGGPTPIEAASVDHYRRIVEVNQTGTFLGMRACVPGMMERAFGVVVNVASIEGLRGMAGFAAYCGSKHAVIGMTRAVALETAARGVRVNAICPGAVMTPGLEAGLGGPDGIAALGERIPAGRPAAAAEVAALVAFLASDGGAYCTGGHYVVDGGWTA